MPNTLLSPPPYAMADVAAAIAHWLPRLAARAGAADVAFTREPALPPSLLPSLRARCSGLSPSLIVDLEQANSVSTGFQLGSVRVDWTAARSRPATPSSCPRDLFPSRLEMVDLPGRLLIVIDLCGPTLQHCPVYAILAAPPIVVRLADHLMDWLDQLGRAIPVDREHRAMDWRPFVLSAPEIRILQRSAERARLHSAGAALGGQDWTLAAWAAGLDGASSFVDFRKARQHDAFYWSLRPPNASFQRHADAAIFALTPSLGGLRLWPLISGRSLAELRRCRDLLSQGSVGSLSPPTNLAPSGQADPWPPLAEPHFRDQRADGVPQTGKDSV